MVPVEPQVPVPDRPVVPVLLQRAQRITKAPVVVADMVAQVPKVHVLIEMDPRVVMAWS